MSYHHFSTFERGQLQELLSLGYSHRAIAQRMHWHHASIDRKVRRNTDSGDYLGTTAHRTYTPVKAQREVHRGPSWGHHGKTAGNVVTRADCQHGNLGHC